MESHWITPLGRIREVVSRLVADLPLSGSETNAKVREQEHEQLAYAILEFGRMKHQLYRNDMTIVDVTEVAFRFWETRRSITRALQLLEERGLAERTDLPLPWKLYLADFDRQARGGDVVQLIRGRPQ